MDSVHGLTTLSDENPITDVLTHFNEVLQDMDMTLPVKDVKTVRMIWKASASILIPSTSALKTGLQYAASWRLLSRKTAMR